MQDDNLTSVDQDAWVELATTARAQMQKRLEGMREMTPTDLNQLAEALQKLRWLEVAARSHDREVELAQARTSLDD